MDPMPPPIHSGSEMQFFIFWGDYFKIVAVVAHTSDVKWMGLTPFSSKLNFILLADLDKESFSEACVLDQEWAQGHCIIV